MTVPARHGACVGREGESPRTTTTGHLSPHICSPAWGVSRVGKVPPAITASVDRVQMVFIDAASGGRIGDEPSGNWVSGADFIAQRAGVAGQDVANVVQRFGDRRER